MKPIICATDYSENSASALRMAYELSKKFHSQLIVLHVFDMGLTLANPLSITHAKKEKATFSKHQRKLKEFCKNHLNVEDGNDQIKLVVKEHAMVNQGIQNVIRENDPHLLVMGFKGKGTLKEIFMGSTTRNMIFESECPVLAVPTNWKHFGPKNILYATDFEESDISSIDWLVKTFAKTFDTRINVFHVFTADEYAGEDQMQWFQEMLSQRVNYGKIDYETIHSNDVLGALMEKVNTTTVDILAMLEREKGGFFSSLVQGDKVNKMISHGNLPILSFNKSLTR